MRKAFRAVGLTLCAAGYGILASAAAWAQNPIKDGQIYYYTGAATINTSLLEMVNGQLVGNDVIVGRTPDGTNLGTSLIDAYTLIMAAGAEISTQNEQHDVYVFNRNSLVLSNSLNNVQAFSVNAYDGSLVTVNGGNVYNINSIGDDTDPAKSPQVTLNGGTVFQMYLRGASQTAITGGTVSQAVQAAGMSSLLVSGGYQSLVNLTNSATLTASGGRTNTLRADGTAQVTINNGGQVGQLGVSGMATATVNGGSVDLVSAGNYSPFFGQSHVVINNGSINTLGASGNTIIDLHGGMVQNAEIGGENVTFNMDGGTIAGYLKVEAGTNNNLSSGAVGELDVYQNALVDLRGGTMSSPIRLLDTGLLNLYGNGLQIVGTSAWSQLVDGNVRSGTAYNVTGILQNNNTLSSFVIYDQDGGYTYDALNPARQFNLIETGNSPVTILDNIYYITAPLTVTADLKGYDVVVGRSPAGAPGAPGDVNLGTTDADKYSVTFAAGTNTTYNTNSDGYNGVQIYNENTALVMGGTIDTLSAYDGSTIDMSGGTVTNDVSLQNNAVLNVSGGKLGRFDPVTNRDKEVKAYDNATVNLSGSGLITHFTHSGMVTSGIPVFNMSGGTAAVVELNDNAIASVTGGNISVFAVLEDQSKMVISGKDTKTSEIRVGFSGGSPEVVINGGTHNSLIVDRGTATISDGLIKGAVLSKSSIFNIMGGTVSSINAYDSSTTNLFGGYLGEFKNLGAAHLNLYGGTFGNNTIYELGDGFTSLFAQSYTLGDGIAANYTDVDTGLTYYGFFHDLNATFADGSLLSTRYFEAARDSAGTTYHPQFAFSAAPAAAGAPEAPSLLLCVTGFALFGVGRGRRGKDVKSLLAHGKPSLLDILKQ